MLKGIGFFFITDLKYQGKGVHRQKESPSACGQSKLRNAVKYQVSNTQCHRLGHYLSGDISAQPFGITLAACAMELVLVTQFHR